MYFGLNIHGANVQAGHVEAGGLLCTDVLDGGGKWDSRTYVSTEQRGEIGFF